MAVMMTACTTGTDNDSSYYAQDAQIYYAVAEYDADWVLDNQVIDHTKFTYNSSRDAQSQLEISHFPYLLTLMAFPEINGTLEPMSEASTSIMTNDYAYSSSSLYYSYNQMSENISYDVELAGTPYTITLKTSYIGQFAFYDIKKDTWSMLLTIHGISRADKQGTVLWEQSIDPAMELLLLTTKRTK